MIFCGQICSMRGQWGGTKGICLQVSMLKQGPGTTSRGNFWIYKGAIVSGWRALDLEGELCIVCQKRGSHGPSGSRFLYPCHLTLTKLWTGIFMFIRDFAQRTLYGV